MKANEELSVSMEDYMDHASRAVELFGEMIKATGEGKEELRREIDAMEGPGLEAFKKFVKEIDNKR